MFITGRMLNISFFITQPFFAVPKYIRLNSMHNSIWKIPNKLKLQQIPINLSSDTDLKDFMNLHLKCTANVLLHQIISHVSERIF